jgi:hypothetical protein
MSEHTNPPLSPDTQAMLNCLRQAVSKTLEGFLLQYFWVNQKANLEKLTAPSDDFLPTLARYIYSRSFS